MIHAEDLMTFPLVTLRTWQTMRSAARTFLDHDIGGAPVLDHEGRPIGVLTKTDVIRYETQYAAPTLAELRTVARETGGFVPDREREEEYVSRWMTRSIVSVPPEAPLDEVASVMARHHLHRVFVEENGELVGVITAFDALRAVGAEGGGRWRRARSGLSAARRGGLRAARRRATSQARDPRG